MFHISTHPTLWNCAKLTVSLLISWLFWRGPTCDQKAMCKMDYSLIWWFLIAHRCSRLFWSFGKRYDLTSVRHCRALPCRMDQDLVVSWRVAQHRPQFPQWAPNGLGGLSQNCCKKPEISRCPKLFLKQSVKFMLKNCWINQVLWSIPSIPVWHLEKIKLRLPSGELTFCYGKSPCY